MTTTNETSTNTAVTAKPVATNSAISKDWSWVVNHLLALAICAAFIVGGVYETESFIAKHDAATTSRYETILTQQQTQTKALSDQLQADEKQWAQMQSQLMAQNSQLTDQINQRNLALLQEVKNDATLSAQQAASKISEQLGAAPQEVVANGDSVDLDLNSARGITSRLDTLSSVQQNLADTQKQLTNETEVATGAEKDLGDANSVIASQKTQIADATKSCDAQVATVKAQARKGKIKAFFSGAGVVLLGWAMHAAGI